MKLTLVAKLALTLPLTILTACSFVDTIPGSETIVMSHSTEGCERIGETHVKVLAEIAGIERDPETIADELTVMARNSAFNRKANTITPISEVEEGQQSFALFRCR